MQKNAMRWPAALCALLLAGTVSAQVNTTFECVALVEDARREEASMASELIRWEDGRLRLVEKGAPSYAGEGPAKSESAWIDLFGAQAGHGSSYLGCFQARHFKCAPV